MSGEAREPSRTRTADLDIRFWHSDRSCYSRKYPIN